MSAWGAVVLCAALAGSPSDVSIVLSGPAAQTDALTPVLRELLDPHDVTVDYDRAETIDVNEVVTPNDDTPVSVARVWVDLSGPGRASLYVADAPWERVFVRHFPLDGAVDEVTREQLGHAVEAAVDTLLDGGEIGVFVAEAKRDLVGETPPKLDLWVHLGYQASFWGSSPPAYHGPLGGLSLNARRPRLRPGAALLAQYLAPTNIDVDPLRVRLQGVSIRALATIAPTAGAVTVHVGVGGALEVVSVRTRAAEPAIASAAFTHLTPIVATQLGLGIPIGSRLEIRLDATLDFDLVDTHYNAKSANAPLFDPWIVRPGIRLSLPISALHPQKPAARDRSTSRPGT